MPRYVTLPRCLHTHIKEPVTLPRCLRTHIKEPVTLPRCSHTFCEGRIKQLNESGGSVCPECRHPMPRDTQSNILIQNLKTQGLDTTTKQVPSNHVVLIRQMRDIFLHHFALRGHLVFNCKVLEPLGSSTVTVSCVPSWTIRDMQW